MNFDKNLKKLKENLNDDHFCNFLKKEKKFINDQINIAKEVFDRFQWAPDMYNKFIKIIYDSDLMDREYYDN